MLIKERQRPHKLVYFEALLRRTPSSHPSHPELKENVRRRAAGYAGECWFDKICTNYNTDEPYIAIPDYSIQGHQIDTLFIFPSFILLIEIKNISGFIEMDGDKRQFSRTLNGVITGMANPDDQLYRHEKQISKLIDNKLPVIGIVVFTNSSCVLSVKNVERRVIHSSGFPYVLDHLIAQHRNSLKHDPLQLSEFFLSLQPPVQIHEPIPLPYPILTGIFCPDCLSSRMTYSRKFWRCSNCGGKQKNTHLPALQDYRLLIGNTISNREFRWFSGINSRSNAAAILQSANFETVGNQKSLRYIISETGLY
ncbi:nuclease-related domain-containing protein [Planococcus sp. N064]|uniref:Nuclease-related domain-containing protein n=1 Tax=Planococcus liqunii TaxID=3058394 RepID=A0ABT8MNH4_9BACL|nr:nuclease-related domain-containing protein [Planococcus sp. N064]MDN7226304.1 nuclease-related domain-containing protein [Planococcus sp. N064]